EKLEAAVSHNLSASKIAVEIEYLRDHPSYERPYGWAWVILLAAEAHASPLDVARVVREPLRDLAQLVASHCMSWLHAMPAPVRQGVHPNTSFALGLMHDAGRKLGLADLERLVSERGREWFERDKDSPAAWERNAHDFLSPGLSEADFMRRVLSP